MSLKKSAKADWMMFGLRTLLSANGFTIILMPFSSMCTSMSAPVITGSPS